MRLKKELKLLGLIIKNDLTNQFNMNFENASKLKALLEQEIEKNNIEIREVVISPIGTSFDNFVKNYFSDDDPEILIKPWKNSNNLTVVVFTSLIHSLYSDAESFIKQHYLKINLAPFLK